MRDRIRTDGYEGMSSLYALTAYGEFGTPVGDFLYGVLTNDLRRAMTHADKTSVGDLDRIFKFVYNRLPMECWGSQDAYSKWIGTGVNNSHLSEAEYVLRSFEEAVSNLDTSDRRMVLIDLAKKLGLKGGGCETKDDMEEADSSM